MTTSGERVRFWRRRKKLTLRQVEAKTKIPRSRLSRIENDEQSLRSQEMELLVTKAFGITVGRFYGKEAES